MWSLRWHFTNKSVTGAPYSIKGYSYSLSHSRTLWWRVRWLKQCRLEVAAELQQWWRGTNKRRKSRCRHGKAPQYLVDCCTPVTNVVDRQRLRSATLQLMVVTLHRLSTVGRRAFAVHGPMVWNSLPDNSAHSRTMSPLHGAWTPGFSPDTSVFSALKTFLIIALYKSTFTIPYHSIWHSVKISRGGTEKSGRNRPMA